MHGLELKTFFSLGALLLTANFVAACGDVSEIPQTQESSSSAPILTEFPIYSRLDELIVLSDRVVIGKVGEVLSREVDDGGRPNDREGARRVKFMELSVEWASDGSSLSVPVVWPDLDAQPVEGVSDLLPGDEVVIFGANVRVPDSQQNSLVTRNFMLPLGADGGVCDVEGEVVTCRRSDIAEVNDRGILSLSLSELKDRIQATGTDGKI